MPKNWYMACAKSLNFTSPSFTLPITQMPYTISTRSTALPVHFTNGFDSDDTGGEASEVDVVTWRWYVVATCSCILRTNAIALRTYKPTVPKQSFIWGIDRWKSSSVSAYDSAKTACFTLVLHKSTTTLINSRYEFSKALPPLFLWPAFSKLKNQSLTICCIPCCCLFYGFVLIWCIRAHTIY